MADELESKIPWRWRSKAGDPSGEDMELVDDSGAILAEGRTDVEGSFGPTPFVRAVTEAAPEMRILLGSTVELLTRIEHAREPGSKCPRCKRPKSSGTGAQQHESDCELQYVLKNARQLLMQIGWRRAAHTGGSDTHHFTIHGETICGVTSRQKAADGAAPTCRRCRGILLEALAASRPPSDDNAA